MFRALVAEVPMPGVANTVQTCHPDRNKSMPRVARPAYEAIRHAILQVVPRTVAGIAFKDLPRRVAALLPADARSQIGSIPWYTTVVKLDLEARGVIERVPGVLPQRVRRPRHRT
jgi:hypothetical protein